MGIRKSAAKLTPDEREAFLRAVITLKGTVANPNDPPQAQISVYDQLIAIHLGCLSVTVPTDGSTSNFGHQSAGFGPWHREYLLRFERALKNVEPEVSLPYWDWTDHDGTFDVLFQDDFLGPNGSGPEVRVMSGCFSFDAPGSGSNSAPRPAWWPQGLDGWRIPPPLAPLFGTWLTRQRGPRGRLTIPEDVGRTLARSDYEDSTREVETDPLTNMPRTAPRGFRDRLEAGPRMHNFGHGWLSGHMGHPFTSPNDPFFFLHHCNVDRLWAAWQQDGHGGPAHYPAADSGLDEGHKIDDPLWPWVGAAQPDYQPNFLPAEVVLPDYSQEQVRTARDVLDHTSLGYTYA